MNTKAILITFCVAAFSFFPLSAQDWALYGVDADEFHYGLSRIKNPDLENNNFGYIDSSGQMIIPYKYKRADNFFGPTAVVQTDDDTYGIINRKGEFVFGPGNYRIREVSFHPGVYELEDLDTKKYGLFDGTRLVVDIEWDNLYLSDYPFVNYYNGKDYSNQKYYNLITQESFSGGSVSKKGNYIIYTNNNPKITRVYDKNGEPLDITSLQTSSQGIEIFKYQKNDYGLRNKKTGEVLIEPVFFSSETPFWINNMIYLYNGNTELFSLIKGDGQIIRNGTFACNMMPELIQTFPLDNSANSYTYYDYNGKEVTKLKDKNVSPLDDSRYIYSVQNNSISQLFDLKTQVLINGKYANREIDGMVAYINNANDKSYFYNTASGKILGPYDYVNDFNEGAAVVTKNQKDILIDKNGNEYRMSSNLKILGNKVSEGIFKVIDEDSRVRGYLYNPFGHGNYVYNQKGGQLNDIAYSNVLDEAYSLYKEKKYALAMNKFYQLMMLKPEESSNFNNYASCLYNLGKYDEALTAVDVALEHWPDNTYAVNLKKSILNALNEQEREKEYENATAESSSNQIWDAIGNYANALYSLSGTYNDETAYVPSYMEKERVTSSGDSYIIQYQNWERRAESIYGTITSRGASITNKKGEKSGVASKSMGIGNSISMKRCFREAQREMRDIRRKASKEGIQITQSRWETATISY